jgi:low affinity Fe/Cu permease
MPRSRNSFGRRLEQFSTWATAATGSTVGFSLAGLLIAVWLLSGPLFRFSNTWQLVINTATTIVTFLMVFLIQRSQNKESLAVQLKLNELVASKKGASNRLIDIEDLTEEELRVLHQHFRQLVVMAKKEIDLTSSHSVEEAQARHSHKVRAGAGRSHASTSDD